MQGVIVNRSICNYSKWEPGHLDYNDSWQRLAIDTTHYGSAKYLTIAIVDCGLSRFSIKRWIFNETKEQIPKVFN